MTRNPSEYFLLSCAVPTYIPKQRLHRSYSSTTDMSWFSGKSVTNTQKILSSWVHRIPMTWLCATITEHNDHSLKTTTSLLHHTIDSKPQLHSNDHSLVTTVRYSLTMSRIMNPSAATYGGWQWSLISWVPSTHWTLPQWHRPCRHIVPELQPPRQSASLTQSLAVLREVIFPDIHAALYTPRWLVMQCCTLFYSHVQYLWGDSEFNSTTVLFTTEGWMDNTCSGTYCGQFQYSSRPVEKHIPFKRGVIWKVNTHLIDMKGPELLGKSASDTWHNGNDRQWLVRNGFQLSWYGTCKCWLVI